MSASPSWGVFISPGGPCLLDKAQVWPHPLSLARLAHIWSKGNTQVSLPRHTLGVCRSVSRLQKYLRPPTVEVTNHPMSPCILNFQAEIQQHRSTLTPCPLPALLPVTETCTKLSEWSLWKPFCYIWDERQALLSHPLGRGEAHSTSVIFPK